MDFANNSTYQQRGASGKRKATVFNFIEWFMKPCRTFVNTGFAGAPYPFLHNQSLVPQIRKIASKTKPKTLKSVFWVFGVVIPWGLEPQSKEPESFILSIELRNQMRCKDNKKIKGNISSLLFFLFQRELSCSLLSTTIINS